MPPPPPAKFSRYVTNNFTANSDAGRSGAHQEMTANHSKPTRQYQEPSRAHQGVTASFRIPGGGETFPSEIIPVEIVPWQQPLPPVPSFFGPPFLWSRMRGHQNVACCVWEDEERGAGGYMKDLYLPIAALCVGVEAGLIGFDVIAGRGPCCRPQRAPPSPFMSTPKPGLVQALRTRVAVAFWDVSRARARWRGGGDIRGVDGLIEWSPGVDGVRALFSAQGSASPRGRTVRCAKSRLFWTHFS